MDTEDDVDIEFDTSAFECEFLFVFASLIMSVHTLDEFKFDD